MVNVHLEVKLKSPISMAGGKPSIAPFADHIHHSSLAMSHVQTLLHDTCGPPEMHKGQRAPASGNRG